MLKEIVRQHRITVLLVCYVALLSLFFPFAVYFSINKPMLTPAALKYYNGGINLDPSLAVFLSVIIWMLILALFALIIRYLKDSAANVIRRSLYILIGIIVLISLVMPPYSSTDCYYYMAVGKLQAYHGVNPYLVRMLDVQDSFLGELKDIFWFRVTANYPPVFLAFMALISYISQGSLIVQFIVLRLVTFACYMVSAFLIGKIQYFYNKKMAVPSVAFFMLNPLVVNETLVNCHNDIMWVMCALLAVYLLIRNKNAAALSVILFAAWIKFIVVIIIPPVVVYVFFADKKNFIRTVVYASIPNICILIMSYCVYFRDALVLKTMSGIGEQFGPSTPDAIFLIAQYVFGYSTGVFISLMSISKIFLLSFVAYISLKVRDLRSLLEKVAQIFLGVYLFFSSLVNQWFWVSFYPFVFFRKRDDHFMASLWITGGFMLLGFFSIYYASVYDYDTIAQYAQLIHVIGYGIAFGPVICYYMWKIMKKDLRFGNG